MYVELPQLQILNLPKVVVKTKTGKVMVIVMMKIIIRDVNLMEEIVVGQLLRKIGAKLANVWILNLEPPQLQNRSHVEMPNGKVMKYFCPDENDNFRLYFLILSKGLGTGYL